MKEFKCSNHAVKGTSLPQKDLLSSIQVTINQSLKKLSIAEKAFMDESYIDAISAWSSLRDKGLIAKITQFASSERQKDFTPVQYDVLTMFSSHIVTVMNQNPTICRVKLTEKLLEALYLTISQPCWNH